MLLSSTAVCIYDNAQRRNMKITVILCTYNRAQSLALALESVAGSVLPGSISWEVLVVDNNSSDNTREVVEEFTRRYPGRFRYLFEPRAGKSHALNSGIRESSGEVLAFMDDDVTVDGKWLENLTARVLTREWAGSGGKILPQGSFTPPPWLTLDDRYALAPLAIFDLGTEAGEMNEPPFGTNMAFCREVFEKVGEFRTDLGPCPGSETRSEDTEFGYRVMAVGLRIWYEPSAIVYHSLPAHRLQKQYFLDWWYDKARADIKQDGVPSDTRWLIAGVPHYLFRRFCVWGIRWLLALEPGRRFTNKLKTYRAAGMITECYRHYHGKIKVEQKPAQVAAASSSSAPK